MKKSRRFLKHFMMFNTSLPEATKGWQGIVFRKNSPRDLKCKKVLRLSREYKN